VVRMEQGWERAKAASFAFTSTAMPMLTGTVVTAAGFLPVGLARSTVGEYTFSIFAVTTMALLVSWVVSVLFVPYLGYKLLPDFGKAGARRDEAVVYGRPFYRRFRALVAWCVDHRGRVIGLENGPPVGFPVQFRVIGEDKRVLRGIADEVAVAMRANRWTRDTHFDWDEPSKVIRLRIDQERARVLGVSTQELSQYL